MSSRFAPLLLVVATAFAGCDSAHDDDHKHEEESPEAEACEHLTQGPASVATASTDSDLAPDISKSHTRHDLTLAGDADKKGGYVKFIAAKSGDYVVVMNADVPAQVVDAQGNALTPKSEATLQAGCAAIKRKAVYTLGVATYRLKLGPTSLTSVGALFEAL